MVADPAEILKGIERFYGQEENESFSEILKELDANKNIAREVVEAGDDAKAAEALANEVPIVKFVNLVLQQAVQDRASDIHFEPFETRVPHPLPRGRRALRNGAAAEASRAARDLAHQGHVQPEHFRETPAAGRAHQPDGVAASRLTCACRACPRRSANPSCCAFWIVRPSTWKSNRSACRNMFMISSPK